MGGGGSTTSTVSSNPWKGQERALIPLFESALYGATGRNVKSYDEKTLKTEYNTGNEVPDVYRDFFAKTPGVEPAGKLQYFGEKAGYWDKNKEPISKYTDVEEGAPTIAQFTTAQKEAQEATKNLARDRIGTNYNNSLLGKSESELKDIISGRNDIPYWNIHTPVIGDPGDISGQKINYTPNMSAASIGYNPNMSAASIGYNPNMKAADFDYRFWNPLGDIGTGKGGNDYLDDMVSSATRGLQNRYTNQIIPYLNSSAEEAGAGGSGAWADLRAQESENYLKAIGDVESNIRGNAFNNQLQAQLAALGLGGELASTTSGYEQEANRLNTQFGLDKALANAGYEQEANRLNPQLGLQKALATSGYEQEANRLNTQLGLQKATTEAGYGQEAGIQNTANDLSRYLEGANIESDINKQNALLKTQTDTQNINNIMQAITGAPAIGQAGYDDIGALAAVGAERQSMNQDILDAYISREEQGNLEPWNRAALLSQLIGGNFGGTATQTAKKKGK